MNPVDLDRQPLPRGDWSGNPATFYRPHSQIGGDLPPDHPWLDYPLPERARRWASGERPDMAYRANPAARHQADLRVRRNEVAALRAYVRAIESLCESWLGKLGIVSIGDGRDAMGNAAVLVLTEGDVSAVRDALPPDAGGWPVVVAPSGPIAARGETMVGLVLYDPDLAGLGNAVSPFQEVPSYEYAHLAMQRRPEDRYDPRYDAQQWFVPGADLWR